jgi:hypothetical protein
MHEARTHMSHGWGVRRAHEHSGGSAAAAHGSRVTILIEPPSLPSRSSM